MSIWSGVFFAIETDTRHYIAYTDGRVGGK
jgi:hypothetical protein